MSRVLSPVLVRFPVGLEEGVGYVNVHSFTVPGCVASGVDQKEALEALESVLSDWLRFIAASGEPVPASGRDLEISVDEWISVDAPAAAGATVLFDSDRVPLTTDELAAGLRRLGALRARLIPRIRRARNEELAAIGREDRNLLTILDELARAQWWLLTRLGASPLAQVPDRIVARLDTAMALIIDRLTRLTADDHARLIELDGEEWTSRKVLRHLLWVEWALGAAALAELAAATDPEP